MTKEQIEKLEQVDSFEGLSGYHEVMTIDNIIFKGTFLNGKREGLFEELDIYNYEEFTGEISSGFYKNDMKDGMWVSVLKKWSGNYEKEYEQKEIYNYFEDEEEGNFFLYANEKLIEEGCYHNGMKNGLFKTYYKNGNINEIISYKNDKIIGLRETYDEDGSVKLRENYNEHGELHGIVECIFNDPDDFYAEKTEYFNNIKHGYSEETSDSITKSGYYEMGRKVGEWVYADLENGKGEIIIYHNPPTLSE